MTVTERIDTVLKEKGMSRRQLAIDANIPTSSLQAAMARGRNMTIEMLMAVAGTLNISTDYLLGLSDETTPDPTLKSICKYTGLSARAVTFLHYHDVDPFVRSFYRELIDSLILFRDDGLYLAPDYIIEAAQAAVIAEREIEKSYMPTHTIDNTVTMLSKANERYTISAFDAEKFFFAQALAEVTKSITETLERMKLDLIEDFKKRGSLEPGEFQWLQVSDDELKELYKEES